MEESNKGVEGKYSYCRCWKEGGFFLGRGRPMDAAYTRMNVRKQNAALEKKNPLGALICCRKTLSDNADRQREMLIHSILFLLPFEHSPTSFMPCCKQNKKKEWPEDSTRVGGPIIKRMSDCGVQTASKDIEEEGKGPPACILYLVLNSYLYLYP